MDIKDRPFSKEAEMAVLGAVLLDSASVLNEIMGKLKSDYFYFPENRLIFDSMRSMFENNDKIDIITVKDALKREKSFQDAGGDDYLTALTDMVAYIPHYDEYVRIVEEKFILRHLIETSKKITESCYKENDVDEIIDMAEAEIFKVQENRYKQDIISMREGLAQFSEKIKMYVKEKKAVSGLPTGFNDIDISTTGFQKGELIIIAARPGVGKTSFALNMLVNSCIRSEQKYKGLIFSLEMTAEQLISRMICSYANISGNSLRRGQLSSQDSYNLSLAMQDFEKAEIYIDDSSSGTPIEVKAKARRMKKEKDIDFVIIDYIQMMRLDRKVENKQVEVSEISRSLKLLAKELNIPVIALAQLSRNPEKREDKKPVLSDIRDSGSIEQDADVVMFIHRKFNKEEIDEATIILAKQRNGQMGYEAEMYFDSPRTMFKQKER